MKKLIITIILIILIIIIGLLKLQKSNKLTKKDNNKVLEITYKLNAGIPFKWEVEVEDESIVKYVKSYVLKDENEKKALVGAPVYTNYVFKGLKKGTTTITFKLVNFADNYTSKEEKYKVKVDKDNNISLIKEK